MLSKGPISTTQHRVSMSYSWIVIHEVLFNPLTSKIHSLHFKHKIQLNKKKIEFEQRSIFHIFEHNIDVTKLIWNFPYQHLLSYRIRLILLDSTLLILLEACTIRELCLFYWFVAIPMTLKWFPFSHHIKIENSLIVKF